MKNSKDDTITIDIHTEKETNVKYVLVNGEWKTEVNNAIYPILTEIENPIKALISSDNSNFRKIWFQYINGKYIAQESKYISMLDYTVYNLKDYVFILGLYVHSKKCEVHRAISIDVQKHWHVAQFSYKTFDSKVFLLAQSPVGNLLCTQTNVTLTDVIYDEETKTIEHCKLFYFSDTVYCYWTGSSIHCVSKKSHDIIPIEKAKLSFSDMTKFYVIFTNDKVYNKGINRNHYQIGGTCQGVFKFDGEFLWEYLYVENETLAPRSLKCGTTALCPQFFHDYLIIDNKLYLVCSSGTIITSTTLTFRADIIHVDIAALPMVTLLLLILDGNLYTYITCKLQEGVLRCQETDSH